jgi:cellobiose phosphorylase
LEEGVMKLIPLALLLLALPAQANELCQRLIARQWGAVNVADNRLANMRMADWNDCLQGDSDCSDMVELVTVAGNALVSICVERSQFMESCTNETMDVPEQAEASLLRQRWTRSYLRIEQMRTAITAVAGTKFDRSLDYCSIRHED